MDKFEEMIEEWKVIPWIDIGTVEKCLEDGMPVQMLYDVLLCLVPENFDILRPIC